VILAASRHRGRQFRMTRVVAACRISLAGVPGIFTLAGMGLQIPPGGLVVSIGDGGGPQMEVKQTLLRLDLWPTWLEIGCVHAEQARSAGERLSPGLSDAAKYTSLSEELQASLVAVERLLLHSMASTTPCVTSSAPIPTRKAKRTSAMLS
jgi:hypothetical protein